MQTFDPQPDGYTMILNDAIVWATGWNARAQTYRDQSKGRLGVLLPSEGSVMQINTINLVKGAKNSAAALAFMQLCAVGGGAEGLHRGDVLCARQHDREDLRDGAGAHRGGADSTR